MHIQRLAGTATTARGRAGSRDDPQGARRVRAVQRLSRQRVPEPDRHFQAQAKSSRQVGRTVGSNPSTPDVGFDGAIILSPSGSKVKVYSDPSCPTGYGWALRLKDWRFTTSKASQPS